MPREGGASSIRRVMHGALPRRMRIGCCWIARLRGR